ncbi:MAG: polysaccharide deacetylase family protein, partial [Planctomycetota bacterium]
GGVSIEHFAYPCGYISFPAKKIMQKDYKTMRSIQPGINHGTVDLNLLKAISISGRHLNRSQIRKWIKMNAKIYGWLIFFTHGVRDMANEGDVKPEELRWVIEQCKETDGDILSVKSAYNKLTSNV